MEELSGGQCRRVVLARALITRPEFVVCDEPIAMADVSVRALILELMKDLKNEFDLTYLFITHDLATAKYLCDRIAVMYLGRIVEIGSRDDLFSNPHHPYTKALLDAVPVPDPDLRRTEAMVRGEIPSAADPPGGCHFHPRCPFVMEHCRALRPPLKSLNKDHLSACYLSGARGNVPSIWASASSIRKSLMRLQTRSKYCFPFSAVALPGLPTAQ